MVNRRILIVEDDMELLDLLTKEMEAANFVVRPVHQIKEVIPAVSEFHPQLILADIDMKKDNKNGLDMLHELRQQEIYTSVIFLSGIDDTDLVVNALQAGADDYLRKPVPIRELLARIEARLSVNELHEKLLEANNRLLQEVDRDYLTGLYNMRSMYDRINHELKRARRFKRNLACVMMDLDHFKNVNDLNDHLFGSYVLKEFGEILAETVREIDFAARFGGDEFLVVLTETNQEGVDAFCERLRQRIESHVFIDGESKIQLTISIGSSVADPSSSDESAKDLVRRADHALYEAKSTGRNRVVSSS